MCVSIFLLWLQVGRSTASPRNRASPVRLFELNAFLEDTIIGISLGGVPDIGTSTMKGDLIKFIMKCYDPELSRFVIPKRENILVDAASVHIIWGLPKGGKKVVFDMYTVGRVHDMPWCFVPQEPP